MPKEYELTRNNGWLVNEFNMLIPTTVRVTNYYSNFWNVENKKIRQNRYNPSVQAAYQPKLRSS